MTNPNEVKPLSVEETIEDIKCLHSTCPEDTKAISSALHHLTAQQEAVEAGGWIKCSERMPILKERVLISNGKTIGHARRVSARHYSVVASNDQVPIGRVTHWQPLPPPPTESDDVS